MNCLKPPDTAIGEEKTRSLVPLATLRQLPLVACRAALPTPTRNRERKPPESQLQVLPTKPIASTVPALDSAGQERGKNPHTSSRQPPREQTGGGACNAAPISGLAAAAVFWLDSVSPRPSPCSRVPSPRSAPTGTAPLVSPLARPRRPHTPTLHSAHALLTRPNVIPRWQFFFTHSKKKKKKNYPFIPPMRDPTVSDLNTIHSKRRPSPLPPPPAHNTAQSFNEFCSNTNFPA